MVPLAGAGLVRLWQVFPVTVGANIGYGRPGANRQQIEEAARHAGAHDFIEKPYQDRELLRCIRSAIQRNLEQDSEHQEKAALER